MVKKGTAESKDLGGLSPVRRKLSLGQHVLGVWSLIPSPILAEISGLGGLDFQIFDMEHGPFDFRDVDASIRAAAGAGCAPLVRVPSADPPTVQRCLDLGAHGVVFPQLKGLSSAKDAVATMNYAPGGRRGFNPFTRAGSYAGRRSPQTPGLYDPFALRVLIIEGLGAARQLHQIASLDGVDVIYLGVYDMSIALGCDGDVSHPKVLDFVTSSARIVAEAGKALGLMARTEGELQRALALGARFLVYGVDTSLLRDAVADAVAAFRRATP